ncbi:MAG: PilZ domain-containing protein [Terriglobales bacterium]
MDMCLLLVCADQDAAGLLMTVLAEMEIKAEHTPSILHGMERIDEQEFDAIAFDYRGDQASDEFLARLRQSDKNGTTMLIALVDEQCNARPLFGRGANFVLYRPLTAERTRLSMNAARGLMRGERRSSSRTPLYSTASISYPGAPDLDATLINLSDTGTLISTQPRKLGDGKVYFEFALPGQAQLVRLSGEVAWQDFSGRAGINFVDVPQASRKLIQAWLQKNAAWSGEEPVIERFALEPDFSGSKSSLQGSADSRAEDSAETSNPGDRRQDERVPCQIGATVHPVGTTTPHHCSLSDISEGGCYVEMPSPLPGKADVEIVVRTSDRKFKIQGEVLSSHPGFGMGVRFVFQDTGEREEILRVLALLSAARARDEQPC